MNRSSTHSKVQRMTGVAILAAIVVVLQILSSYIHFGPVNITLALAPIIIGAAIYGIGAGTLLGCVHGLVVLISGLIGLDGGFVHLLMSVNPPATAIATVAICVVKSTAAGFAAGVVYRLIAKKNDLVGVIVAGIVCPVVNTGLFLCGMFAFFISVLEEFAGGAALFGYAIGAFVGTNFIIELAVNMLLAAAITRIIRVVRK